MFSTIPESTQQHPEDSYSHLHTGKCVTVHHAVIGREALVLFVHVQIFVFGLFNYDSKF